MSLTELRPAVQTLPRCERFLLVQELIAELAKEEGMPAIEYPIWSPYAAHDAAAILLQMLEREKASAT
jgi:hypothetical protein